MLDSYDLGTYSKIVRNIANYIMLAIALFFALLQPFLHIHLDTDHPVQQTGFHVANAYEEMHDYTSHIDEHSLNGTSHTSAVIVIEAAVKQEVDLNPSADTIIFALILFCISLLTASRTRLSENDQPNFYRWLKRQIPASRAPPQH